MGDSSGSGLGVVRTGGRGRAGAQSWVTWTTMAKAKATGRRGWVGAGDI